MFRSYDIRGVWNKDLDPKFIMNFATALSESIKDDKIGIGMDVRMFSHLVKHFLIKYLNINKIYDYGIISTPLANFASIIDNIDVLMITASHNPSEYIGIKPIHKGALDYHPRELIEIKELFGKIIPQENNNKTIYIKNILDEYFSKILELVGEINRHKIYYDASNGSGFLYLDFLKTIFDVKPINTIPDGRFPSHTPDPTKKEAFKDILKFNPELGFVLDGDCDRVGIVYKGSIVESFKLIIFFAETFLKKGDKVVLEITVPYFVDDILKDNGIGVVRSMTGRVFVKRKAIEENAKFFAEYSGHFGFKEFYYIDDGLYTFLKFVKALDDNKEIFDEIMKIKVFSELYNIPLDKITDIEEFVSMFNPSKVNTFVDPIDGKTIVAYELLFDQGRILIRRAYTEPMYRLKVESINHDTFILLREKVLKALKELN